MSSTIRSDAPGAKSRLANEVQHHMLLESTKAIPRLVAHWFDGEGGKRAMLKDLSGMEAGQGLEGVEGVGKIVEWKGCEQVEPEEEDAEEDEVSWTRKKKKQKMKKQRFFVSCLLSHWISFFLDTTMPLKTGRAKILVTDVFLFLPFFASSHLSIMDSLCFSLRHDHVSGSTTTITDPRATTARARIDRLIPIHDVYLIVCMLSCLSCRYVARLTWQTQMM